MLARAEVLLVLSQTSQQGRMELAGGWTLWLVNRRQTRSVHLEKGA
jgi:hypothetical protein